jgi:hypothetical protein
MKASIDNRKGWFRCRLNTNWARLNIIGGGRFMVEAGVVCESVLCCHKFAGDSWI